MHASRRTLMWLGLLILGLGAPAATGEPPLRFDVPETTVRSAQTRVIPFRVEPTADRRTPRCTVDHPDLLEVCIAPVALPEHDLGFLRVRGLAPGATTLRLDGVPLKIRIVEAGHPVSSTLDIVSPATGAVVWGSLSIGLQWSAPPTNAVAMPTIELEVHATGADEPATILAMPANAVTGADTATTRHLRLETDFDRLPPGPCELRAVVVDTDGSRRSLDSATVIVVRPNTRFLLNVEAEASHGITEEDAPYASPDVPTAQDADASGGAYVANYSPFPAVAFPMNASEPGWYQLIARARGTLAGAAYPTVAVLVDQSIEPVTNGRILADTWHRVAIGVPVRLDRGDHAITPFFGNDFFVPGLADRNLDLDRFELLRVAGDGGARPGPSGRLSALGMAPGAVIGQAPDEDAQITRDDDPMAMMGMQGMAPRPDLLRAGTGADRIVVNDLDGLEPFRRSDARVAIVSPADGAFAPGLVEIVGTCSWAGQIGASPRPAPMVALEVNGYEITRQRSGAPRFWLDSAHLTQRENEVRLVAISDDGSRTTSPAHTVRTGSPIAGDAPDAGGFALRPARAFHRFTIHDARWDTGMRGRLRNEHQPAESLCAGFYSPADAALTLPEEVQGEFDLYVEARAQHYDGPPIVHVTVENPDERITLEKLEIPEHWDLYHAGTVTLDHGEKRLLLRWRNDKHRVGFGDRNWWLQSVVLMERSPVEDNVPPTVRIEYPDEQTELSPTDAVVFMSHDTDALRDAELLVDGEPTRIVVDLSRRGGRAMLPLLTRGLTPGSHHLAVRVTDAHGHTIDSRSVAVTVPSDPTDTPTRYQRAVYLLDRFGFGPDADSMASLLAVGERDWLREQLDLGAEADLSTIAAGVTRYSEQNINDVPRRVIHQTIATDAPVRARLTLWIQNHFSTWIRKTEPDRKWDEHLRTCALDASSFTEAVVSSATSPAMIRYLDQDTSYAGRINENYAREILELHTLGVDGGYTQDDVRSLATMLTGWTATTEGDGASGGRMAALHRFGFDPTLNDPAGHRILGVEFPARPDMDGTDRIILAIETMCAHPSTARFVARKLAHHYVANPAPDALVDDLTTVYQRTDGDLREMLLTISEHQTFWDRIGDRRVAQPFEYAVRLARCVPFNSPDSIARYLDRSGTGLFDRATPDGYPDDDPSYADSNAIIQRWQFAREVAPALARRIPDAWTDGERQRLDTNDAQRLIDLLAANITGGRLSDASNRAALDVATKTRGDRARQTDALITLLAQLPEANTK